MDLLIDVGNSTIEWTSLDNGVLGSVGFSLHEGFKDPVGLFNSIWGGHLSPNRILVSNVAGEVFSTAFKSWVEGFCKCPVVFVKPQSKAFGVVNGYTEPEKLGIDRWLALVGARTRTQDAVIIVDVGTAITVDALNKDGQHLGGVIAPGLNLMRTVLLERTSDIKLGEEDLAKQTDQSKCFASDTSQAIVSGTNNAIAGMINQTVSLFQAKMETPILYLITGGDAKRFLPMLANKYQYEPALVLHGLAKVAGETR
ncbi:MAG: type III pantothenate kinase [Gammaproteobacteria bacterium]|nr:type III pantothenate kinase [Gammaproteobacteria bacterium]